MAESYNSKNPTWLRDKLNKYILLVVLLPLLSLFANGCVTTGRDAGWPIQTFTNSCDAVMIPSEVACLTGINHDRGFKYRGQFSACKQSMLNYLSALDEYYRCSSDTLKGIFDDLLLRVSDTFNCYVNYFKNRDKGDPSVQCPPVDIPRPWFQYEAEGLEINFGVPLCIAKSDGYNFAPQMAYQLDDCREQVEVFMSKSLFSHSSIAHSAQDQYNTYLRNLKWVIDQKADDAASKFNCIAEGRKYCF